ncbi:uncharacterized protein LOC141617592 [Silene latifolia]|uniref:uncharacterized protein LOC141617592 n=1 Tax=Silene latifolia TaxID=37657 RepID=UPI003D770820
MWSLDPSFQSVVQDVWNQPVSGTLMFQVAKKLKALKKPLKLLNRNKFADMEKDVGVAKAILDDLQIQMHNCPTDHVIMEAESEATISYRHLCKVLHSFLSQKVKIDWLKMGDENTSFFHGHIRTRQIHNRVMYIRGIDDSLYTNSHDIETAFLTYYKELLGSSQSTTHVHFPTVRTGPVISEAHADLLLAPVSADEIHSSFLSIPSVKSPGPDGFTSQFYKDSWEIVGVDTVAAI